LSEINVSVIVPAYNEETVISDCLNSLMELDYPKNKYEVIVVNDGSTDKTTEIINDFLKNYSNIILLSKENGGKASAQNIGLESAKGEYILITDADAVVKMNWILKMTGNLKNYDIALGSFFAKETNNWLEKIQNAHYLIKFKFGGVKGIPPSGVNIGFRTEIINKIGTFNESKTSITKDFINRAQKCGLEINFDPEIVVFTKCTKSFSELLKQKLRWRESILADLKREQITFFNILSLGYTYILSFLLLISFILSIFFFDFQLFMFAIVSIFLISFLLYVKPFLRLCSNTEERMYAIYFILYLFFEIIIIRLAIIPYLIYRLIKPREKPTFEGNRE